MPLIVKGGGDTEKDVVAKGDVYTVYNMKVGDKINIESTDENPVTIIVK